MPAENSRPEAKVPIFDNSSAIASRSGPLVGSRAEATKLLRRTNGALGSTIVSPRLTADPAVAKKGTPFGLGKRSGF